MAFLIYAKSTKYIKILKNILSKQKVLTLDTEFPEAIITTKDPQKYIPAEMKNYFQIEQINDYKKFLKGFNSLVELLKPSAGFKEGDTVKIIKGTYEGLVGIVKKVNEKNLEVEIAVWGRIVKDIVELDEVEKIINVFD